jgi:hypothetical protein
MIAFLVRCFSAIQRLFGLEPAGRKLTDAEIEELKKVFDGTVDFPEILIKEGKLGLLGVSGRALTLCNSIYIPGDNGAGYGAPGTEGYLRLLVHETVHVWQYQTGGTDYITGSLKEQLKGWWSGKGMGDAYQFERGISEGKRWDQLNPEQQARLIEDSYAFGLFKDENIHMTGNDGQDHTDYARAAIRELLAKRGAP